MPVTEGGLKFDSRGEYARWVDLRMMEKAGLITDLRLHPRYKLTAHGSHICDMIPDYQYRENGRLVVEDHKQPATITPEFKLKAKLLLAEHGIEIRIVGRGT